MDKPDDNRLQEARGTFNVDSAQQANDRLAPAAAKRKMGDNPQFMRLIGSAPWLKARERQQFRTKVFQSGNSLAVRVPTGTKLEAGMEMELTVEDGVFLSLEPVERPKRKFDIAKVAGSARGLNYVDPGSRSFEPRKSETDPQARSE
jgi:antitoxin VapB